MTHPNAGIRDLIAEHTAAVRAKDLERVLAAYAPEVMYFDLPPPLRFVGRQGQDATGLARWFESWTGPIGLEHRDLSITADGDVAFTHGLVHMTGTRTDGTTTDVWVRQTLGLRRIDGAWKIAHEHTSVPFHMDGSERAALDLKP